MRVGCSGQALIEGIAGLAVVALFFGAALPLLHRPWERLRCARALFEETHRALTGARPTDLVRDVAIRDEGSWVVGRARCAGRIESVRFRKLGP